MGLFDALKDKIFGHKPTPPPAPPRTASSTQPTSQPSVPAPATPALTPSGPEGAAPKPVVVDVEAILDDLNSRAPQKLNWRTSIVDLLKLLGLDSGLKHRQELARELGYSGDTNDSAAMNIWLHQEVMKKLAANGGKVPATLQ